MKYFISFIVFSAVYMVVVYGQCPPYVQSNFYDPVPIPADANGDVTFSLVINEATTCIGEDPYYSYVYNGSYSPPFYIAIAPGKTIYMTLINNMTGHNVTNFHFHGMNVSPLRNGDNVLLNIQPGTTFNYEVKVPADHRSGLYWFHSHAMAGVMGQIGLSDDQVNAGLSGGIEVLGIRNIFPAAVQNAVEHKFLLKQAKIDLNNSRIVNNFIAQNISGPIDFITVNGLVNPIITMKPGELQFWRFAAIAADQYFNITFGGFDFHIIAIDGNTVKSPIVQNYLYLGPANRIEVFVYGPNTPGDYTLLSQDVSTGSGPENIGATLATIRSTGPQATPIAIPPGPYFNYTDLRPLTPNITRQIVFGGGFPNWTINGKQFNEDRVDITTTLGMLEEWQIINITPENHVFHIHQLDFQILSINNLPVNFTGWQDTITLPIANGTSNPNQNGSVTIRIPFWEETMVGKFVYHCHVMFHEDRGMMAIIQVNNATISTSTATSVGTATSTSVGVTPTTAVQFIGSGVVIGPSILIWLF